MDNAERQEFYEEMIAKYQEILAGMDIGNLASFLVSMESSILSFEVDVRRGDTYEQAEERHNIKVLAIATALSNHPYGPKFQIAIEALRELAGARLARKRYY